VATLFCPKQLSSHTQKPSIKNLAAKAFGRLGGIKGGKARAEKFSEVKRV
jgi:hypothetical protein